MLKIQVVYMIACFCRCKKLFHKSSYDKMVAVCQEQLISKHREYIQSDCDVCGMRIQFLPAHSACVQSQQLVFSVSHMRSSCCVIFTETDIAAAVRLFEADVHSTEACQRSRRDDHNI